MKVKVMCGKNFVFGIFIIQLFCLYTQPLIMENLNIDEHRQKFNELVLDSQKKEKKENSRMITRALFDES